MTSSKAITPHRMQRTIARSAKTSGVGFLTGADITIRFLPAEPGHGIAFQRTDCSGSQPIPATIEHTVPRRRRTAIEHQSVVVEMTEHVMAAFAGLQIDNCLVQLNAPEPPGCDGSSRAFVEALLEAGSVEQDEPRELFVIENSVHVSSDDQQSDLTAGPLSSETFAIRYRLDYGPHSPIRPQTLTVEITPETFLHELAVARTFVLEEEVEALQAEGYGSRTTARDLLVYGANGVIDNQLRFEDECVRHKILDCLGDFALLGCDIQGQFTAHRSGHQLNRKIIQQLKALRSNSFEARQRFAA